MGDVMFFSSYSAVYLPYLNMCFKKRNLKTLQRSPHSYTGTISVKMQRAISSCP